MSKRELKEFKEDNDTRLNRSCNWATAAKELLNIIEKMRKSNEKLPQDNATYFIFWWIAFESLFACHEEDKGGMKGFIKSIVLLDEDNLIAQALKQQSKDVLALVKLRATHSGMWENHAKKKGKRQYENYSAWKKKFDEEVSVVKKNEDISEIMKILFERLRTVRNQVFHGANSLAGSHGSSQVSLGAGLLAVFIPIFLEIVKKSIDTSPPEDWGQVTYPRIGERDQKDIRPPWAKKSD